MAKPSQMTDDLLGTPNTWGLTSPEAFSTTGNDILCLSQNVRSNRANGNSLKLYIKEINPSIVFIQETWGSDLRVDGYKFSSKHRKSRGGGVSILYKHELNLITLESDIIPNTCEYLIAYTDHHIFFNVYRPPQASYDNFIAFLRAKLELLTQDQRFRNKLTVLAGDFNINLLANSRQSSLLENTHGGF